MNCKRRYRDWNDQFLLLSYNTKYNFNVCMLQKWLQDWEALCETLISSSNHLDWWSATMLENIQKQLLHSPKLPELLKKTSAFTLSLAARSILSRLHSQISVKTH